LWDVAVLISPWCDLTHSFPSILQNTKTDIIRKLVFSLGIAFAGNYVDTIVEAPYGFIYKPSVLWPPPPEEFRVKTLETLSSKSISQHYADRHSSSSHKLRARDTESGGTKSLLNSFRLSNSATLTEEPQSEPHEGNESPLSPWEAARRDPKTATSVLSARQPTEVDGHRATPQRVMVVEVDGQKVELTEQIQVGAAL
jgi:hypothetical protein